MSRLAFAARRPLRRGDTRRAWPRPPFRRSSRCLAANAPTALLAAVTLKGDAAKSGTPVWVEDPSGHAYTVERSNGYTARFDPGLTVFDAKGAVVARAGDVLDLGVGHMFDGYDWFACSISHHGNP
jgi:hypothetical protein